MALSDAKAKAAKIPEGKKQAKLADGGGLYLLIKPSGKYWRFDYRFAGKRKTLALGVYPTITLKAARDKRDEAKRQIDINKDPGEIKQQVKRQAYAAHHASTFEAVAIEWKKTQLSKWGPKNRARLEQWLTHDVFPWIGNRPPQEIEAPDILLILRRIESAGHIEKLHRVKSTVQRIFAYAIAHGLAQRNPAADISSKDALTPLVTTHRATITEPKQVGELMRAIQSFQGTFVVQSALRMTPYVFLRPGELRQAEWSEIDLAAAEWRIPAQKMKMGMQHQVPLARQVVDLLKALHPLTGSGRYVFPSVRTAARPMSNNTVNAALRRLGYEKDEICAHGFRAMASTMLHEQGWPSDAIERQLAHKEGNAIKGAYNHARHLPERIRMMQSWADYLDGLRDNR